LFSNRRAILRRQLAQLGANCKETYELIGAANLPNETSLSYLQGKYADQVNYYGKYFSRDEVASDKATSFRGGRTEITPLILRHWSRIAKARFHVAHMVCTHGMTLAMD
jgi:hypothetical protein